MSSVSSNSSSSTLVNQEVTVRPSLRSSFGDNIPLLRVPSQDHTSESSCGASNAASSDTHSISSTETPISPLASFYDAYFLALSCFAHDKAKEIVDKQQRDFSTKQGPHSQAGGLASPGGYKTSSWLVLMTCLSYFAGNEKGYMNLSFLTPKGFLRKDSNLKSAMQLIKNDMKKLSGPLQQEQILLRDEILALVGLRMDLMEFYEKLSILGTAKNVEIGDLLSDIELIGERFSEERRMARSTTAWFFKLVKWELDIVTNLLKAHSHINNWEFLPSLISLQEANRRIVEWQNHLQEKEWIGKLKAVLLAKFSLYFYDILAKNSNESHHIRSISAKLQHDFQLRLSSFQKKSDSLACCLIFDARGTNFHSSGYQHPFRKVEIPQGMESFPAILAIPSKPSSHWPGLIMLLSDKLQELNADKFVGFYDQSLQATYFLMRVDVKMYLTLICETKKSEKDGYVMKFMSDLATDLKCGKIFSSLKLGAK